MARWRTGRGSCQVGVEPHDTNRADEEARDLSTSRADVDPPKPATAQCVAGIEASMCMPALGRTEMTKKSTAELVALESRRLSERLTPRHRGPAASPGLSCTAVSRLVLAVLLATVSTAVGCGKTNAASAVPAPEVEVATVAQKDVPIFSEWVATLDGYVNAQIQPQVAGYVIRQTYKEGSFVRKGQILFQIDPRPFQALLDQANAQLAQAQAQLGKTQMDVDRDTPLAKARAIAQSQLDNDVQANRAAQAAVKAAEARVEQAKLNLE